MIAQFLRPFSKHGKRLLPTSASKTAGDHEERHVFTGPDAHIQSSATALIEPMPMRQVTPLRCDEEKPKLYARLSNWVSKSIDSQLANENEPHYMFAQGEGEFYIPEPSATVPPAGFAGVAHESAANVPVAWAMGEMPWMGMYQAPVAPYQQVDLFPQQTPSDFPSTTVLMQPMIMPMFYPFGGMQMSIGTEQLVPTETLEGYANFCEQLQEDAAPVGMHQLEATVAAPKNHRRSKRGGAAPKNHRNPLRAKRVEAAQTIARTKAAQSEEANEVRHADSVSLSSTRTSEESTDLEIKNEGAQSFTSEVGSPSQVDSATDGSACCDTVCEGSESVDAAPTAKVDPVPVGWHTTDPGRREWIQPIRVGGATFTMYEFA